MAAKMIASRLGTAASAQIGGLGSGLARGHLLAKTLGGDGADVRNLVPIAQNGTNLQQFHAVENLVKKHVLHQGTTAQKQIMGNVSVVQARGNVNVLWFARLHTAGLQSYCPLCGNSSLHHQ
jgi:hypothetical protein